MSDEAPIVKTTTVSETSGPTTSPLDSLWAMKFDNRVRALIACAMVAQFIFSVIYSQITNHPINSDVFVVDVTLVTGAVGYYIGSSSGSTNKTPIPK